MLENAMNRVNFLGIKLRLVNTSYKMYLIHKLKIHKDLT